MPNRACLPVALIGLRAFARAAAASASPSRPRPVPPAPAHGRTTATVVSSEGRTRRVRGRRPAGTVPRPPCDARHIGSPMGGRRRGVRRKDGTSLALWHRTVGGRRLPTPRQRRRGSLVGEADRPAAAAVTSRRPLRRADLVAPVARRSGPRASTASRDRPRAEPAGTPSTSPRRASGSASRPLARTSEWGAREPGTAEAAPARWPVSPPQCAVNRSDCLLERRGARDQAGIQVQLAGLARRAARGLGARYGVARHRGAEVVA